MTESKLVALWLREVGLEYIQENFEAAGIVTPQALSELQVNHFQALGVEKAEDRRKLFYLVQRIKLEVEKEAHRGQNGDTATKSLTQNKLPQESVDSRQLEGSVADEERDTTDDNWNDSEDDFDADGGGTSTSGGQSADDEATDTSAHGLHNDSHVESGSRSKSGLRRPTSSRHAAGRTSLSGLPSIASKTKSSKGRRLSGVPRVSGSARNDGRDSFKSSVPTSHSFRTGKALRPIPSDSVAPMSPLVDIPLTQARSALTLPGEKSDVLSPSSSDEDSVNSSRLPPRRRRTFSNDRRTDGHHSTKSSIPYASDSTEDASTSQGYDGDKSSAALSSRRRSYQVPGRSLTKGAQSFESRLSELPRGHHRNKKKSTTMRRAESADCGTSKVGVGVRDSDDSFKAQIETLREANNDEYKLARGDCSDTKFVDVVEDMRIRVIVRKRPMSRREMSSPVGDVDIVHPLDHGSFGRILVYQPRTRVDLTKEIETIPFAFDNVFDERSTTRKLYERSIKHLIPSLLSGQWVNVFAYGQTGSGKTFTMMGSSSTTGGGVNGASSTSPDDTPGLCYMAVRDMFDMMHQTQHVEELSIGLSMFEIYSGKLFDLLNDRTTVRCLENSEGRVCFPDLTEHSVRNAHEVLDLIETGSLYRSTGTTSRNADSSRSHAVLQIHLNRKRVGKTSGQGKEYSRLVFIDLGKMVRFLSILDSIIDDLRDDFLFVDVAGSERGADTSNASRTTRMEGAEINCSLLALKEVIRALATGDSMTHVPFRGSKLTQVLKESFVGNNSRSVMIACISPNIGNCEQTLNTLRYADRVKERNAVTGSLGSGGNVEPSLETLSEPIAEEVTHLGSPNQSKAPSRLDVSTTSSEMLDDILASPVAVEDSRSPYIGPEDSVTKDADAAFNLLVVEHNGAMSTMMEMFEEEMMVAESAGTNNISFDLYMKRVTELHEKQMSCIEKLRERLQHYYEAKDAQHSESGESFDDLRV